MLLPASKCKGIAAKTCWAACGGQRLQEEKVLTVLRRIRSSFVWARGRIVARVLNRPLILRGRRPQVCNVWNERVLAGPFLRLARMLECCSCILAIKSESYVVSTASRAPRIFFAKLRNEMSVVAICNCTM